MASSCPCGGKSEAESFAIAQKRFLKNVYNGFYYNDIFINIQKIYLIPIMCSMIYTLEEIKELVEPIAQKYELKTVWVFGSYARGEATEESDVDFLLDDSDSKALNLCGFIGMANEFEQSINKKVDLLSIDTLYGYRMKKYFSKFMNTVTKEKILVYKKPRY